jgi:outer membrane lipoprotein SlyB
MQDGEALMSYMDTHAAFAPAGEIQELSFDEIDEVGGARGDRDGCIAMTSVVGGLMGAVLGGGVGSIIGGGLGAWYGSRICPPAAGSGPPPTIRKESDDERQK